MPFPAYNSGARPGLLAGMTRNDNATWVPVRSSSRFWRVALTLFVPAALLVIALSLGADPDWILLDPAAVTGAPFYTGLLSNLGVLGWCGSATALLLAAAVLRSTPEWTREAGALAAGASVSAVLGFDDLLLLHERVLPNHLGVPEPVTFGAYGVAAVVYLWHFRDVHLRMDRELLGVAFCMFAVSLVVDLTDPPALGAWRGIVEDGAKFLGISAWASYHVRFAASVLGRAIRVMDRYGHHPR